MGGGTTTTTTTNPPEGLVPIEAVVPLPDGGGGIGDLGNHYMAGML